jgi:hypothetical protein
MVMIMTDSEREKPSKEKKQGYTSVGTVERKSANGVE